MGKFTDERIHAAIRGTRQFRTYEYPGLQDVFVACRVLSEAELDQAQTQAQVDIRSIATARGWDPVAMTDLAPEQLQRCLQRQILWRAFFDADTTQNEKPEPFFPTLGDVLSLDSVTTNRLFQLYAEHQAWVCPFRSVTDEKEIEEFISSLGKSEAPGGLLTGYEPSTLARFVISLASRVRSMTSPMSSASTSQS